MSNIIKSTFSIIAIVFLPFSIFAQTAYETDAVDYYVSDNAANESLEEVNFVMCMMNAMAADKMVNRGPYKVSLYEDDCDAAADASATNGAAAKPKSAKSAETKKSTTTTTGSTAKTVTIGYADVTRADTSSPQKMKAWVEIKGQVEDWAENMSPDMLATMPGGGKEPDITVYLEMLTTTAPSATSQFGEFDLAMSFTLSNFSQLGPCPDESATAAQKVEVGCALPAGASVGGGRILASGDTITYVDYSPGDPPVSAVLKFTGDIIEGIATKESGFGSGAPDYNWFDMEKKEAFVIDNGAAAVYCSKTIAAGILDFDDFVETDGYRLPKMTAVTLPHVPSGTSDVENCYSLKESDANKNVHRYGVYDLNGDRAALTGVSAFPMTANVTDGDGAEIELFGWADNWNIHVDNPGNVKLWDESTIFTKEQYAGETGTALQIKIAEANQRMTKYEKSYLALSDLDKLTMITWINPNDDTFGAGYQALGFTGSEAEYSGSYNKTNEKWTITKKIDWSSGWNETTLGTPIEFTNAQAISALSSTNEDSYTQQKEPMNGLQINTWRLKITDYLQGAALSASAAENIQYWWLGGPSEYTGPSDKYFGGYPWGKDTGDQPGIDLENLQGLINGTANARPIKVKGYFGNLPNSGSGNTNIVVKLTHGDDAVRSGTGDQVTFTLPFAWSSTGSAMTMSIAAGTTITGIYNDGGAAASVSVALSEIISKTFTMDVDGDAAFEVQFNSILKDLKTMSASFASFFSDGQQVNMLIDFGALPVYTVESQSEVVNKFALTTTVKSSPGVNAADAWTNERGLWAWSPDTGNGYDIGIETLRNPTSNSVANGIQMETRTELTPSQYPAKLKCVFNCTSASTINATASAAKALSDYGTVVSPYIPATVQYVKSGDQINEYYPGVLATDTVTYTPDGLVIKDAGGTAMGFASSITEEDVRKGNYKNIPSEYYTESLEWGIRVNKLLGGTDAEIATQLATLECERSDNTKVVSNTNAYRDTHPIFSATATRYCENAFYDGGGPTTWYEMEFGAAEWQRKKYAKDAASGLYVNFSKPKVLYYDVPDDAAAYGNDAGKSVRLDFGGFGDLWGIPGNVINVQTGEVIGEFVNEWNDDYRYVQRFAIEPHSTQAAGYPVLYEKATEITYKVKALEGEQWLKKKDSAKGTLSYTLAVTDLPKFSTIRYVSPTIFSATGGEATVNPDSIGAIPAASTLINSGKPAVIHGDLAVTF